MMPWPYALLRKYPLEPSAVPERPWWRHHAGGWTRRDKQELWLSPPLGDLPTRRELLLRAAQVDATQPLAEPPIRAGQVWAFATESGSWLEVVVVVSGARRGLAVVAIDSGMAPVYITPGWVEGVQVARRPAFLVADPLYPLCAPWAPVATKPHTVAESA